MYKILFTAAFAIACAQTTLAQPCGTGFLGTKTLYTAPGRSLSAAPAHYEPVFINYVGRHGARHLTKEVNTAYAWQLLHRADSAHSLTPEGLKLKQMVDRLAQIEHEKVKSISAEGEQELCGIGSRMAENYLSVFKASTQLNVAVTKEIRTQQSAGAFLQGLKAYLKDSVKISEHTDDTHLRFYDAAPAYVQFEKEGSWQQGIDQLEKQVNAVAIRRNLISRLFTPAFERTVNAKQADKFTGDIYGFVSIMYSLANEIKQAGFTPEQLNFSSVFTCDELASLGKLDAADDYLKKGPGANVNGLQVRIAAPLLVDFIQSTDEFMKTGQPAANLRFAHAETILPYAALLSISSADKVTPDLNYLDKTWQAGRVGCLSSNIQWVFYKNKGGDYLVKVLLNEREARIDGLSVQHFPYYDWKELRKFYINKLTQLNVKLTDDMDAYLKNIK